MLRRGRQEGQGARRQATRSRRASSRRTGTAPAARRPRWRSRRPAMQLQGQWAPGHDAGEHRRQEGRHRGTSAGSRSRASTGGAGAATDGFGGGNGFAVGKDAPPEAVEFLKYISEQDAGRSLGRTQHRHPAGDRSAPRASVTDPNLTSVLDARAKADVRPALPRPGDLTGARARRSTTRSRRCSPGPARPEQVASGHRRDAAKSGGSDPLVTRSHSGRASDRAGPSRRFGTAAAVDRRCSCCPRSLLYARVRHHPDRPGGALQPLRLERARAADRLRRARRTTSGRCPTRCSSGGDATT